MDPGAFMCPNQNFIILSWGSCYLPSQLNEKWSWCCFPPDTLDNIQMLLLIGPLERNFNEICNKILQFWYEKINVGTIIHPSGCGVGCLLWCQHLSSVISLQVPGCIQYLLATLQKILHSNNSWWCFQILYISILESGFVICDLAVIIF